MRGVAFGEEGQHKEQRSPISGLLTTGLVPLSVLARAFHRGRVLFSTSQSWPLCSSSVVPLACDL